MYRWLEISANQRVLAYILFSMVVLGGMFVFGIYPARQQIAETRREAADMKARIEEQKILIPLYERLKEKAENVSLRESIVAATGLEGARFFSIENASEVLFSMARSAGIQNASFSPAPSSMHSNSDQLLIHGVLKGKYPDFRDFLLRLAASPGFQSLEMLDIKSGKSHPEYGLRIWISID